MWSITCSAGTIGQSLLSGPALSTLSLLVSRRRVWACACGTCAMCARVWVLSHFANYFINGFTEVQAEHGIVRTEKVT